MPAPRVASLLLQRNAAHVARFDKTKAKPLGLNLKTAVVTCASDPWPARLCLELSLSRAAAV